MTECVHRWNYPQFLERDRLGTAIYRTTCDYCNKGRCFTIPCDHTWGETVRLVNVHYQECVACGVRNATVVKPINVWWEQ